MEGAVSFRSPGFISHGGELRHLESHQRRTPAMAVEVTPHRVGNLGGERLMAEHAVTVNRAPVLTLWGAVVCARLGYDWDEALTLGKAVAGLNAQAKGRMIGVFGPPKGAERGGGEPRKTGLGEDFWVEVVGRPVPAKRTAEGVRAVIKDQPIDPADVQRYLERKFKEHYQPVREAMEALAGSVDPEELEYAAYGLYEQFRPKIPSGKRGWGVAGTLDLGLLWRLAAAR